ncbi:MAG: hypothetical protein C5B50_19260 [Verrucomicrobia bacterium]|nr:MAG: hypothetical protein C5B50_19260 [Verrucomicrobiota bacterium]
MPAAIVFSLTCLLLRGPPLAPATAVCVPLRKVGLAATPTGSVVFSAKACISVIPDLLAREHFRFAPVALRDE